MKHRCRKLVFMFGLTRGPKAMTLRTDSMKKKMVNTILRFFRTILYSSFASLNYSQVKIEVRITKVKGFSVHKSAIIEMLTLNCYSIELNVLAQNSAANNAS